MDQAQTENNSQVNTQLDRIEAKVDKVVARVDKLEGKASIWGAIGGILFAVANQLAGCM